MKEEIYRCDMCKKIKGERNHWFAVGFSKPSNRMNVSIARFEHVTEQELERLDHFCGEECLFKRLSTVLPA